MIADRQKPASAWVTSITRLPDVAFRRVMVCVPASCYRVRIRHFVPAILPVEAMEDMSTHG